MSSEPDRLRLVRVDQAGARVDVPGVTGLERHDDEPPATGGTVTAGTTAGVGERGCTLLLPRTGLCAHLSEEQRSQLTAAMLTVGEGFRRMADALIPAARAAVVELAHALERLPADRGEPAGRRRRTGRDAQESPYGPRTPRRPR